MPARYGPRPIWGRAHQNPCIGWPGGRMDRRSSTASGCRPHGMALCSMAPRRAPAGAAYRAGAPQHPNATSPDGCAASRSRAARINAGRRRPARERGQREFPLPAARLRHRPRPRRVCCAPRPRRSESWAKGARVGFISNLPKQVDPGPVFSFRNSPGQDMSKVGQEW